MPTNRFAYELVSDWLAGKTIRVMLLTGSSTSPTSENHNVVADIEADECELAGYARQNISNAAVTENDTDNRAELDWDDITFPTLGTIGNSTPITHVAFFVLENDDDDSPIVSVHDVSGLPLVERTPNGQDFIIQIGATGAIHINTTE